MPFTGEEKKAYQREYMRLKRLGLTSGSNNLATKKVLYTQEVTGSSPVPPTIPFNLIRSSNLSLKRHYVFN